MRWAWACAMVLVPRGAMADRDYPAAVIDRPLVLPSGVIELDTSLDWSWHYADSMDANGNTDRVLTDRNSAYLLDLTLRAGIGPVEVFAHTDRDVVSTGAAIELGAGLGLISASVVTGWPQPDDEYEHAESFGYYVRWRALPKLAIAASANATFWQARLIDNGQPPITGSLVNAGAGLTALVQLDRILIDAGAGANGPISYTAGLGNGRVGVGAFIETIVGFKHWDFYTHGGLNDLNHSAMPFFAVGFVHRWL